MLNSVIVVYGCLFLFGVLYASLVHWMRVKEIDEGFTSIQVVVGVAVVIAGCRIIEVTTGDVNTTQMFFAFAFSGFPMTVESIGDYLVRRRNGRTMFGDFK